MRGQREFSALAFIDARTLSSPASRTFVASATPYLYEDNRRKRVVFILDSVINGVVAYKHLEVSFLGKQATPDLDSLTTIYVDCGVRFLRCG